MKKKLLLSIFSLLVFNLGFSQTEKAWSQSKSDNVKKNKNVERDNFPQDFKLFNLNIEPLRSELFSIVENKAKKLRLFLCQISMEKLSNLKYSKLQILMQNCSLNFQK